MDAEKNASKRQCTLEMFVNSVKKQRTEEPIIISESDEDVNVDSNSVFNDDDEQDYLDEVALARPENEFVSQADVTEYGSERNDNVDSSGNDTDVSSVDIDVDAAEENHTDTDQA